MLGDLEPLTLNLSIATDASDRDLTEKGVTFRAKVMALKTVTTVNAWKRTDVQHSCRYNSGQGQCLCINQSGPLVEPT